MVNHNITLKKKNVKDNFFFFRLQEAPGGKTSGFWGWCHTNYRLYWQQRDYFLFEKGSYFFVNLQTLPPTLWCSGGNSIPSLWKGYTLMCWLRNTLQFCEMIKDFIKEMAGALRKILLSLRWVVESLEEITVFTLHWNICWNKMCQAQEESDK